LFEWNGGALSSLHAYEHRIGRSNPGKSGRGRIWAGGDSSMMMFGMLVSARAVPLYPAVVEVTLDIALVGKAAAVPAWEDLIRVGLNPKLQNDLCLSVRNAEKVERARPRCRTILGSGLFTAGGCFMLNGSQKAVFPHLHRLLTVGIAGDATDRQLLDDFLGRRDPAAFAVLVRRHGRMVLNVCQRVLNNAQDAEDAFQATFLVLVRKARSIKKREAVGSWLYGVAHRVALRARADAARRRKCERQAADPDHNHRAHNEASHEARPILDEEVNRLPEKYRRPIMLCYFEGKTYEEAARLLGWPAGTVSIRLARARNLLGSRLARRGLTVASAALVALLAEGSATATVPSLLAETTVQTALHFAAGSVATGVSAHVFALTEGVVYAMLQRKLKILAGLMLAITVLGGGTGMLYRFTGTDPMPAAQAQPPGRIPGEDKSSPDLPTTSPGQATDKADPSGPGLLAPPAKGVRPPQTRIGLINMTRVLKSSKKFRAIEADLRTRTQQVQKELEDMKAQLRKYSAENADPATDARQREENAKRLRQLQAEIDDKATVANRRLSEKSSEACVKLYREIEAAANRVAKRDGIELVMFYTDAVTEADFYRPNNMQRKLTQPGALIPMIVAPGMDITETVISAINKTAAP
jgi:RNA polymerase sigma factor (sigma-70 family)